MCYNMRVWTGVTAHPLRCCRKRPHLTFYKGVNDLPNIKSAKKRVKVTTVKTMQNKMFRTQLKTEMKKYEAAVAAGDVALAQDTYKAAVKKIDKAVARGLLHKNAGARKKSQFTKKLNALA